MKKIIIIIAVVLIVGIGGYLMYLRFASDQNTEIAINSQGFPDAGNRNSTTTKRQEQSNTNQSPRTYTLGSYIKQISSSPVSGFFVYGKEGGGIMYTEKLKGNTYRTELDTLKTTRITNNTLPKVYETFWFSDSSGVMRFTQDGSDVIQSYSFILQPGTTTPYAVLTGTSLFEEISSLAVSPNKDKLFSFVKEFQGGQGIISETNGSNSKVVLNSITQDWNFEWPATSTISMTTKPSYTLPGNLYFIDTKTYTIKKILSDIKGLTTLVNPTTDMIMYHDAADQTTHLYNIKTLTDTILGIITLPEKCVWSKKEASIIYCAVPNDSLPNTLPDSWYQGLVTFSDTIWKIDTSTGQQEIVVDLGLSSTGAIDAVNVTLTPDEDYIIFTNKKDSTLWSLKLK